MSGCEWDPKTNQPADDEHHCGNEATVSLGEDGTWHLCARCSALSRFDRFKTRTPILSVLSIRQCLAAISDLKQDNEAAHVIEDALYYRVLHAIANGHKNPVNIAKEALKSRDIDFVRSCS